MSAVSERIKALIEQSGVSYRSLAKKVGVSNVTVRNWAIGHSEPNREGLEALCEIFGVTPAYVMFGDANSPVQTLVEDGIVSIPHVNAEVSCGHGFLNTDVNAEQDLMASGAYYYQEDDKSLASNQFVYVTNYSAEAGFDSDQYEFTFEDFGYYQEDGTEDEAESTDDEVSAYSALEDSGILENPVSICSGTWKFTVDMDQAKDISYKKVCDQTVSDGEDDVKINRIVLSPMGCSIYMTLPQSQKDSGKYFDNVHIRLKNGSLLSEEYYEMGVADCELSGDDEAADAVKVSRELDFDFRVPIDISQVKAIEIFGESIEVEACK